MSEKQVAIVEAFLMELVDIINEKPALAKRLVEAIEYRFAEISLDPTTVYRDSGKPGLSEKLYRLTADQLRILIKQFEIPATELRKRKKPELIAIICDYAHDTKSRIEAGLGEAA